MFLNNYHYILLNYTLTLLVRWRASSTCGFVILLMQLINGKQFLNVIFLSTLFAVAVFATVIVTLTNIYASL